MTTRYFKTVINDYIGTVGYGSGGIEVDKDEYDALFSLFINAPIPPKGYDYMLRADTLEWELVELPPVPPEPEEATAEDYEDALGRFGV